MLLHEHVFNVRCVLCATINEMVFWNAVFLLSSYWIHTIGATILNRSTSWAVLAWSGCSEVTTNQQLVDVDLFV